MLLPGHDAAREGAPRERIVLKFEGRQKFCRTNRKYFRGHPRTSLAPGIQQPLHATDYMVKVWTQNVGCGGSVVGSVPCVRRVARSNSTLAAK